MTLPYPQILPVPDNAPAVPATWNTRQTQIDANFSDLDAKALQAIVDIGLLDGRVNILEGDSSASVSTAVRIDWLYRNFMMIVELWTPHWTLLDPIALAVTGGVAGDDSVDVASTADLVVGNEYVLYSSQHQESIVVSEILTSTRFRTTADLQNSYTTAILKRCNFSFTGGVTTAAAGKLYYCGPLFLGNQDIDKSIVIRRQDNDTVLRLYFQDPDHSAWTEAPWEWQRTIADGVVDIEYRLPVRNDFKLKLAVEAGVETSQTIIYHIAGVYAATGLLGLHHPPEAPLNSCPADAATDVLSTPTLAAAGFVHACDTPQRGAQFQLSLDGADFSTPLFDSELRLGGISFSLPEGVLSASTEYFWRMRVCDIYGAWSEWSEVTSFTTSAVLVYVVTPQNTAPANAAVDISETPTLTGSAFAMVGAVDTHAKSQWQAIISGGVWSAPLYDSGESDDLTSHVFPSGVLTQNSLFFWRVRYQSAANGWSEWSAETSFTTLAQFPIIFGLALVAEGSTKGTWQHVDAGGDDFSPSATFFTNHPVYSNITTVTKMNYTGVNNRMVKIPKFYYKVGVAPEGADQVGKICWWISTLPADGFVVHPAFKKQGSELDYFLIGQYESTPVGSCLCSQYSYGDGYPKVGLSFDITRSMLERNNYSGESRFHMLNIYEIGAIQMLCLLELGTPDVQAELGNGNCYSGTLQLVTATSGRWRNIYQLWGNTSDFIDGIRQQGGLENSLLIFDQDGYRTFVNVPLAAQLDLRWIVSMRADHGDEGGTYGGAYDLRSVFIPAAVDVDQADGTFSDRAKVIKASSGQYVATIGGNYFEGPESAGHGIFRLELDKLITAYSQYIGSRLAWH